MHFILALAGHASHSCHLRVLPLIDHTIAYRPSTPPHSHSHIVERRLPSHYSAAYYRYNLTILASMVWIEETGSGIRLGPSRSFLS